MVLVFLLFLLSPILGVIFGYFYLEKKDKTWMLYAWAAMIVFFLSCVNMTKVEENDLLWYTDYYSIGVQYSWKQYVIDGYSNITGSNKEIAYYSLVWVLSQIFNGDKDFFKLFMSCLSLSCLNIAVFRFGRYFKVSTSLLLTMVCIVNFFPYIYTMSLQLVRQFTAGSFLMVLLMESCYHSNWYGYIRRFWWLIACMIFTHVSSVLFLPLLCLPFVDKPFKENVWKYTALMLVYIGYQTVAGFLFEYAEGNTAEVLERASQDTSFELDALSLWKIMVVILFVTTAIYIAHIRQHTVKKDGWIRMSNTVIIVGVLILFNTKQLEFSNRMLFYLFPFFPFLYYIFAYKFNLPKSINVFLSLLLILFWGFYLDIGTWTYELPSFGLFSPIFMYFK